MKHVFTFLIITSSLSSFAQQPSIVEPLRISDGGVFGFTLSNDGKEAFWVKSYGGRDTLVVMRSYKRNEVWQKPAPASFSGHAGEWKDIDPVFSPDNKMLLFQSNRPVEGKPNRKPKLDGAKPTILVIRLTLMLQNHLPLWRKMEIFIS